MSRRKVSVKELGQTEYQGWLHKKNKLKGFLGFKWRKYWFVLKQTSLYWYTEPTTEEATGYINLAEVKIEQALECKRKHAMKASNTKLVTLYFAADSATGMSKWLGKFTLVSQHNSPPATDAEECYSEESDHEEGADVDQIISDSVTTASDTSKGDVGAAMVTQDPTVSPPKPESWLNSLTRRYGGRDAKPAECVSSMNCPLLCVSPVTTQDGDRAEELREEVSDEMRRLYIELKQASLYPTGELKPLTEKEFRSSFIRRCKNEALNKKLHHWRVLCSTLKAKEADLLVIEQVLGVPDLTTTQYREWRDANILLLQEIYRPVTESSMQTETANSEATYLPEDV